MIFKAAKNGTMMFVLMYCDSVPTRLRIYSLFAAGVSKTVPKSDCRVVSNSFETVRCKVCLSVSVTSNLQEFRQLSSKNNFTCIDVHRFSYETL